MIIHRSQSASITSIVGTQICMGIGGGMLNVPAQLRVQASVLNNQNVDVATAIYLKIGGAVGSSISGAVWGRDIPRLSRECLPEGSKGDAETICNSIMAATTFPVGGVVREAIDKAYQETMRRLLVFAVCVVCAFGAVSVSDE